MENVFLWLWQQAPGILITIIASIAIGYFFHRQSKKSKALGYETISLNLVQGRTSGVPDLDVLYKGEPIQRLTLTKVAIRNTGNDVVMVEDMAPSDKLALHMRGEGLLLPGAARVEQVTSAANGVSLELSVDGTHADVRFDYLNPGDGAVLRLYHTGPPKGSLVVTGTIMGGSPIDYRRLIAMASPHLFREMLKLRRIPEMGAMALIPICLFGLIAFFLSGGGAGSSVPADNLWMVFLVIIGALMSGVSGGISMASNSRSKPKPRKGFESFLLD